MVKCNDWKLIKLCWRTGVPYCPPEVMGQQRKGSPPEYPQNPLANDLRGLQVKRYTPDVALAMEGEPLKSRILPAGFEEGTTLINWQLQ